MMQIDSENDLPTIVLHAPIGICILNAATLEAEIVNDKFLEVAGKSREVIEGKCFWDSFTEVSAYYEAALNEVIKKGRSFNATDAEMVLVRNGIEETVFISFFYSPIKNAQGRVVRVAVWVIDNTPQVIARQKIEAANRELEKAQTELQATFQQLEESEIALRLAVSAANFGTWYIHSVTREFITDARLKELFGYRPDEDLSIEQALAQITEEYREFVASALENAIYRGGDYDVTYPVIGLHDHKKRWLRAIGNLKADPSGEFSAFTGVVMDITDLIQEEQRKSDFIGMVSHELKTPLTSLNAIIQVVSAKLKLSDDTFLSGAMDKSLIQLKRMSEMINGFLNISRLESGKMLIRKKSFQLDRLIKEVTGEITLTRDTHIINFSDCGPIQVNADIDHISSVLSNLLNNASKYSPVGTRITVACELIKDKVRVSISDEGMGINTEDLERIFERYHRVENKHTQHISGFGIGLYLSAEIIKRHDGKLWAESERGVGSTFYFELPLGVRND